MSCLIGQHTPNMNREGMGSGVGDSAGSKKAAKAGKAKTKTVETKKEETTTPTETITPAETKQVAAQAVSPAAVAVTATAAGDTVAGGVATPFRILELVNPINPFGTQIANAVRVATPVLAASGTRVGFGFAVFVTGMLTPQTANAPTLPPMSIPQAAEGEKVWHYFS